MLSAMEIYKINYNKKDCICTKMDAKVESPPFSVSCITMDVFSKLLYLELQYCINE